MINYMKLAKQLKNALVFLANTFEKQTGMQRVRERELWKEGKVAPHIVK